MIKTGKEVAKEIRAILKKEGIKASVKTRRGGYDDAVTIRVKDLTADLEKIREWTSKFESIDRCEYSMEILSGGNTFIMIDYDHDFLREKAANYLIRAQMIIDSTERGKIQTLARNGDKRVLYWDDGANSRIIVDSDTKRNLFEYAAYNKHSLAQGIAIINARYNMNIEI